MNQTTSEIWVQFAAAAVAGGDHSSNHCAEIADSMLLEYDKRYGETALIINGIRQCSLCSKAITGGECKVIQDHGEYFKYCPDCVASANDGTSLSSPGTMVCTACGFDDKNIFSCPGEPRPPECADDSDIAESHSAYETWLQEDRVWHAKIKVRPLGEKHSFEKAVP